MSLLHNFTIVSDFTKVYAKSGSYLFKSTCYVFEIDNDLTKPNRENI